MFVHMLIISRYDGSAEAAIFKSKNNIREVEAIAEVFAEAAGMDYNPKKGTLTVEELGMLEDLPEYTV